MTGVRRMRGSARSCAPDHSTLIFALLPTSPMSNVLFGDPGSRSAVGLPGPGEFAMAPSDGRPSTECFPRMFSSCRHSIYANNLYQPVRFACTPRLVYWSRATVGHDGRKRTRCQLSIQLYRISMQLRFSPRASVVAVQPWSRRPPRRSPSSSRRPAAPRSPPRTAGAGPSWRSGACW